MPDVSLYRGRRVLRITREIRQGNATLSIEVDGNPFFIEAESWNSDTALSDVNEIITALQEYKAAIEK